MKILVVDDEPEISNLLKEFLSESGYTVTTATSGEEGISKFRAVKPDVVLLDICMPDMDGIQVLKQIKQSNPRTGAIIISAINNLKTVKSALSAGANDYLIKPIDLEQLSKLLTSWRQAFPE